MDITEISILHHIAIVLIALLTLASFGWSHPVSYFVSFVYLFLVTERYILRLRKRLQFEERKQANQRRLLSDSETVRWLNHAVEKIWPICMEQIASQKFLLPLIPWFLDKYKPWTAKKAVVQSLYLGRNPPMFTEIRVLGQSTDDDHLVLELGMNFLSADDMNAVLEVKLRKPLGFGMWAKMHITGMHVEGRVLVGIKFLRGWPFISRMRLCFVEPPYFQMTAKPIFNHGVDVTEVPGVAGWLDKILSVAFEQTLVEPNMLVVDVEKFVEAPSEKWFSMDEKPPIAFAKVEIIEGADMKPSDLNGLADPYVKGQLGPYRFRTKIHKKTLAPKWQEEYKIPICTWDSPNILLFEVRDKDHFVDDTLGDCSINISDYRGGQRFDMWMPLQNIKMGRLHVAITVVDVDDKAKDQATDAEPSNRRGTGTEANDCIDSNCDSPKEPLKMADEFEPINIPGQDRTGVWVHHPGNEISPTWETRKGRTRRPDTQIHREENDLVDKSGSVKQKENDSSSEENPERHKLHVISSIRRGMKKIGSAFNKRNPRSEGSSDTGPALPTPRANIRAVGEKGTGITVVVEDLPGPIDELKGEKDGPNAETDEAESPSNRSHIKGVAKSILKQAGKSAHGLKQVLSRKHSSKSTGTSSTHRETYQDSESTDDSVLSSKEYTPRSEGGSVASATQFDSSKDSPGATENDPRGPAHSGEGTEESIVKKESFGRLDEVNESGLGDTIMPVPSPDGEATLQGEKAVENHLKDQDEGSSGPKTSESMDPAAYGISVKV